MLSRFLHKSYLFFYTFRLWRQRHFTSTGLVFILTVMVSFVFAFNSFRTNIYQIIAFCLTMIFFSLCANLIPFRLNLRIKRLLPKVTTVGETTAYEIEITNLNQKPEKGLILYEDISDPRPTLEALISVREPNEHLRNRWDKNTLYYRFQWLLLRNKKAEIKEIRLPTLYYNEPVRVKIRCRPIHRGYLKLTGITLARSDIFGLFNRLAHIKQSGKLLVLPIRYLIQIPQLLSSRQYHSGGINLASSIGNSDEFMSLRTYRPGDPLRNIHWKSYAKTNEMITKEFEDEYFVRYALLLDTYLVSQATQGDAVFEEAITLASSYVNSVQTHDSILDLMFVGDRAYSFSSGRGLGYTEKMLEILACVNYSGTRTISDLIPSLQRNIKKLSGSISVFLGWDEGHQEIYRLFQEADVPVFIVILVKNDLIKIKIEKRLQQENQNTSKIRVIRLGTIEEELAN